MKYLIILLMLASMLVIADDKYNYYEGRHEDVPADYVLKFDPYKTEWGYVPPISERKYNQIEGRYEIARPDSEIEYDVDYFEWRYE